MIEMTEPELDSYTETLDVPTMLECDLSEDIWELRGLKRCNGSLTRFELDPNWWWICWKHVFYFRTEEDRLMFRMKYL